MGSASSRSLKVYFPPDLVATIIPVNGTVVENTPGSIVMHKPAGLAEGCGCKITFRRKDATDPGNNMAPLISSIHCYTAFDKNIWNNEVGMPKRSDGSDQNDLNLQFDPECHDYEQGKFKDWKHACHLSVTVSYKRV